MLRLNKKTEYALLAIEHMAAKESQTGDITNTREISDTYHIPLSLLAKVLQTLASKGLVKAVQGTKGGYLLGRGLSSISIADVIEAIDGPVAMAECFNESRIECPQWSDCTIKDPFAELNNKINKLLKDTTLADLAPHTPVAQKTKTMSINV